MGSGSGGGGAGTTQLVLATAGSHPDVQRRYAIATVGEVGIDRDAQVRRRVGDFSSGTRNQKPGPRPGPGSRQERTGERPGSQRRGTTRTSSCRGTRYPRPERSCEDGDRERASIVIAHTASLWQFGLRASRVALRRGHRPTWGPTGDNLFCLRRSTLGFANAALLRGRTKTRRRRVCGALAWQGRLISSRGGRCEEQERARCVRVMRGLRGSLFLDLL